MFQSSNVNILDINKKKFSGKIESIRKSWMIKIFEMQTPQMSSSAQWRGQSKDRELAG